MSRASRFFETCRKVICVGRNYVEHARELNNPVPKAPLLFLKPPSAFLAPGGTIRVPPGCTSLHHEVELAVIIGRGGRAIPAAEAEAHIAGYALALDMTARDLQDRAKEKGLPWSVAKVCAQGYEPILALLRDGFDGQVHKELACLFTLIL